MTGRRAKRGNPDPQRNSALTAKYYTIAIAQVDAYRRISRPAPQMPFLAALAFRPTKHTPRPTPFLASYGHPWPILTASLHTSISVSRRCRVGCFARSLTVSRPFGLAFGHGLRPLALDAPRRPSRPPLGVPRAVHAGRSRLAEGSVYGFCSPSPPKS